MSSEGMDLGLGLSQEEKDELDELIRAVWSEPYESQEEQEAFSEIRLLREENAGLANMLLRLDDRLNRMFEIVRLSHLKSEVMREQLESLAGASGEAEGE